MTRPTRTSVILAAAVSWGSMLAHNLYELPLSVVDLENSGPFAVAAALGIGYAAWPRSRVVAVAAVAWAALNLTVGGLVTVLPLPILPFEPEQSATHYLAHLVYALGQVPLLVVGWLAARGSVSEPAAP